jgi:predicted permease
MSWIGRVGRRLAVLFYRDSFDRDLAEEMQIHLEMQAEEACKDGVEAGEAAQAARRRFGNVTLLREQSREAWGWGTVDCLAQDVRYAFRTFRNSAGFVLVAIVSLALGIGANTAMFTVVNAVLLRHLPVPDPQQLVILNASAESPFGDLKKKNSSDRLDSATGRQIYNTFPLAAIGAFRTAVADVVDTFAFFSPGEVGVSGSAGGRPARLTLVSGNFFQVIGVNLALGRGLLEHDDQAGSAAIVITHSFWESSLERDPAILGKVLRLNGVPMTVVGVTDPAFRGISAAGFDGPTDIFAPLSALDTVAPVEFRRAGKPKTAPDYWWIQLMGRRKAGVTMQTAAARLTAVFRAFLADSGVPALQQAKNPQILLMPGDKGLDVLRTMVRRPLLILLAIVGIVLLLACVNLATLQLARSAARQREVAVRLSLGAGRGRIIRQVLIESLVLSALGAVAGALFAVWGTPLVAGLLTVGPFLNAVWLDLSLDLRILGFTVLVTMCTAVLFGLAPALQSTRVDIAARLKDNAYSAARRSAFSLGNWLIAGQAALALILLTGSGLFLRTLGNLYSVDTGFTRDRLLLFRLDFAGQGLRAEQAGAVYDALLPSVKAIPGVLSASAMSHPLINGWHVSTELSSGRTGWKPVDLLMNTVTPEFFKTMGIPVLAGRTFSPGEAASAQAVIVLNQIAARRLCGDRPAVGQILRRHAGGRIFEAEVVGVVRDSRYQSLRHAIEPTVFMPFQSSYGFTGRSFAVRTAGDPLALVGSIRQVVSAASQDLIMKDVKTQTGLIVESLHQERLFATLLTLFACFALLLGAIGLHGVAAYSSARRRGEFGLRVALGAARWQILRLVILQVLRPVAAGTLVGFAASWAATRWIESLLYGVKRFDPSVLGAVFLLLIAVALGAALLPAWRAAHLDPMQSLRAE